MEYLFEESIVYKKLEFSRVLLSEERKIIL